MPVPLDFLQAVGANALPILAGVGVAAAEVGSSILRGVWDWWCRKAEEADRRRELETLAGLTAAELKGAVRELASTLAADHPPAVRSKLEGYLLAVPAQIRRTLRRPSDRAGLTVPPGLVLSRMEDLAPLLPPRPPRFAAGDKVPGTDFELVELLGIGGFGEVWKARNSFMPGAPAVALKFCLDPDAAASLRRETALLDRIQREGKHPGIVELRHTFLSVDPPFLEYELVEGGDLGGLILDWHRQKGGPSPAQAARVIRRLADVVGFAHGKDIVHRDLKPANVLVSAAAPGESSTVRLKIADFGIGGIAAEAATRQALLTRATGTFTAAAAHGSYSLYYASPEQMRGAPPDPRDDVHALGVIWYQLLVGDLTAEAPRGPGWKKRLAAKGMTAGLVELLEACVATDRADRPADAKDVAERLAFVLAEPAPGLDLDLSADSLPNIELVGPGDLRPSARPELRSLARPEAPRQGAADHPPPPKPLSSLSKVAAEAQEQARWEGLLLGLRDIRSAHDRMRWSADWWVRFLCRFLTAVLAAGIGLLAGMITREEVQSRNWKLASEIARQHSTKTVRLRVDQVYDATGAARFDLNGGGDGLYRGEYGSFESRGRGYYNSYRANSTTTDPNAPTPGQKRAAEVNAALEAAATDYDRRSIEGGRDVIIGVSVGGGLAAVLLPLVGWLRRRKLRELGREVTTTAGRLQAEFPAEVADLAEHADLRNPTVVRHLIRAVEEERKLPPEWHGLGGLFHRLFAPF